MSYDCEAELKRLYEAIHGIMGDPARPRRVRHGDYEVEYTAADLDRMITLYTIHWNHCGQTAGLPPLDPSAATRRGRPVSFGQ